jgi:serine/threonine protein kinase
MMRQVAITPGSELGDFRIETLLGRGGFKAVYGATNRRPQVNGYPARVALALPHFQDEEARRLLQNEFRVVKGLDHPNIARQYAIEEVGDTLFCVMEWIEGIPLNEKLRADGPCALADAVGIIRQIGAALDFAHDGLAIHRDIKPANLMLQPDGTVHVLDFGLAKLLSHSQYRATTRVGSVAYMAPEQFDGGAGLNADLWGLGITFYQLITNTLPFPARDEGSLMRAILYDEPDLDPIEHGDFDPRLARVLRKILQKEPEKRYQRAAEFVADLDAVLRHAATVNHLEGNIEVHLRAHFPLLYLVTHEEERALASLKRVREAMASDKPLQLFVWSETRGLRDHQDRPVSPQTLGDPLLALEYVIQGKDEGIYVFLDMHRHFTPVSLRLIRDAIWTVKRKRKSLVFLSPVVQVPEDIRGDATLLFYDLPEVSDLQDVVARVHAERDGVPELPGDWREQLARAVLGLTEREAERVVRHAFMRRGALNRDCLLDALRQKEQIVRKEGLLEFCRQTESMDDVGGLDLLKPWFAKRQEAFRPEGRHFGLRPPKGVVLVGISGCGKSLCAKALAQSWGVPLLRLDIGRLRGKYVGQSEGNLRRALHTAEAVSPCILWVDELEKAFAGLGQQGDSGVSQRMFGAFLTWLEERQAPVFVVATANDISRLPPEFMRGGRVRSAGAGRGQPGLLRGGTGRSRGRRPVPSFRPGRQSVAHRGCAGRLAGDGTPVHIPRHGPAAHLSMGQGAYPARTGNPDRQPRMKGARTCLTSRA